MFSISVHAENYTYKCSDPENAMSPVVNVQVSYDKKTDFYTYKYKIKNKSDALVPIERFRLLTFTPVSDIKSYKNWKFLEFQDNDLHWSSKSEGTYINMTYKEGVLDSHPGNAFDIHPGKSVEGFEFKSKYPPGPTKIIFRGTPLNKYGIVSSDGKFLKNADEILSDDEIDALESQITDEKLHIDVIADIKDAFNKGVVKESEQSINLNKKLINRILQKIGLVEPKKLFLNFLEAKSESSENKDFHVNAQNLSPDQIKPLRAHFMDIDDGQYDITQINFMPNLNKRRSIDRGIAYIGSEDPVFKNLTAFELTNDRKSLFSAKEFKQILKKKKMPDSVSSRSFTKANITIYEISIKYKITSPAYGQSPEEVSLYYFIKTAKDLYLVKGPVNLMKLHYPIKKYYFAESKNKKIFGLGKNSGWDSSLVILVDDEGNVEVVTLKGYVSRC